jgi:membrane-bound lytic murein transglycosylase D
MAVFLKSNKLKEDRLQPVKNDLYIVKVNKQIHFQQVANVIGVPVAQMQYLNPQFKFSIVPVEDKTTNLRLPKDRWDDFLVWQDSIYNSFDSTFFQMVTQKIEYPPAPTRQYAREPVKDLEIEGKTKIQYRLKTGDVLGIIAEIYDVRVADLKYWNNIYNERKIQAGKNLDIFVDDDKVDYYLGLAASETAKISGTSTNQLQKNTNPTTTFDYSNAKKIEHVVKSGESPYIIAKKYDGVTPDEILEWNHIKDARKIQIGQKLIVYLKQ